MLGVLVSSLLVSRGLGWIRLSLLVSSLLDSGPFRDKLMNPGIGITEKIEKVVVSAVFIIVEEGIQEKSVQRPAGAEIGCKALGKQVSDDCTGCHGELWLLKFFQEVAMDMASKGDGLNLS